MLTTYMNPQLTRLDVVTTEDGYLLVLNQVMELKKQKIEHVEAFIKEHKFKPIIMKKSHGMSRHSRQSEKTTSPVSSDRRWTPTKQ